MDEELVSDSSRKGEYGVLEGDGEGYSSSFTSVFKEVFPWYLSIGMSFEEFWEDDTELAVYYRKAERHREDRFNSRAHLQGLYIYEALCDVAPVLHAFAKEGSKPLPYSEKPYPLAYEGEQPEESSPSVKSQEQILMENNLSRMEAFAIEFNKAFIAKNANKEE